MVAHLSVTELRWHIGRLTAAVKIPGTSCIVLMAEVSLR
jgi:hypothetical protein